MAGPFEVGFPDADRCTLRLKRVVWLTNLFFVSARPEVCQGRNMLAADLLGAVIFVRNSCLAVQARPDRLLVSELD